MKNFVPHYYSDFKCKAGECRHSCCVGWEIDIDPVSFQKYKSIKTDFGRKIRDSIDLRDGCFCFKLTGEDERCPFLNENNLCEIILKLGEDYLCGICTDHPRFRNFYSDRTETGLGLCCEEACRIILSDTAVFSLICDSKEDENLTSEELSFLKEREFILKTAENSGSLFTAVDRINERYNLQSLKLNLQETADFLSSLEMLDKAWKDIVLTLKTDKTADAGESAQRAFMNLYKYFLFRHLTAENFIEGLKFAGISVNVIWAICERTDFSFENICEIARMYSCEIEYSDENIDKIMDFFIK